MSKKQKAIKISKTKKVCKNLKSQEFVGFCKNKILETKVEKILKTHSYQKGIFYFLYK